FIARGDEVIILDSGSQVKLRHLLGHPRLRLVVDSVMNPEILDGVAAQADVIYHLAGVVGVEHYVADPYHVLNVNVNGTQIFLGQLLRGEPLTVIGDGSQTRCFTFIDDAVRATVAAGLLSGAAGQIINIGTQEETSIRRLAEIMIELGGGTSTLCFVPQATIYGESYEDVPRRVPDVGRMDRILGMRATTPLTEGLARTIAWFRGEKAQAGQATGP